ncbi:PEP-CTERM sorting domain-containing protein [Roseibacillus persicicus]|uniref:PEP-CTERM sorting domain-containing protein n=1 Tax=Roseibacillus persicicus TaxID=454148 RepID=UPI00280E6E7B|nr:PEP-CTERM sorting domain-containing protein [Roseibacillus persicicus]MDQ8189063.1 PEP-CTERM sorting domain-containing protein [Roseibacillus persicicus]
MNSKNRLLANSSTLLFLSVNTLSGATLARWTPVSTALPEGTSYDSGSDTPSPSEAAANLVVSTLARVPANSFTNAGIRYPGLASQSFDTSEYTEFTIAPASGYQVNLESLSYSTNTYGRMNNADGYTVYVRTSTDGFATDLGSQTITDSSADTFVIDISALQGVDSPTTFRIYAVDNAQAGGNAWFDLDGSDTSTTTGLIISGDVVSIPEPSAVLLLSFSSIALLSRRRK